MPDGGGAQAVIALEPTLAARLQALVGVHGEDLGVVARHVLSVGLEHLRRPSFWTAARDDELRRLWADPNLCAKQIAGAVGIGVCGAYARARRLGLPRRRTGKKATFWTAERDAVLLREWRAGKSHAGIAAVIGGIPAYRVAARVRALKLPPRDMRAPHPARVWTPERVAALRTLWAQGLRGAAVAERWGGTPSAIAISRKASQLRLNPSAGAVWTAARVAQLRELWAQGASYAVLVAALDCSTANGIKAKAHKLGLGARPRPVRRRRAAKAGAPAEANGVRVPAQSAAVPMRAQGIPPTTPPEHLRPGPNRPKPPKPSTDLVAAHIAKHGVTRCPTAAVGYTSAVLPAADAAALRAHEEERAQRQGAMTMRSRSGPGLRRDATPRRGSEPWPRGISIPATTRPCAPSSARPAAAKRTSISATPR